MRTISVVLVDDSPEIRQLLVPHLETTAVDVVGEAADGEAALEFVRRLAPDVVVMDVHLPGVDGIQAMRESSACHPQAIVVAFTDSDETGVEEAICQAGAVRHFQGPPEGPRCLPGRPRARPGRPRPPAPAAADPLARGRGRASGQRAARRRGGGTGRAATRWSPGGRPRRR